MADVTVKSLEEFDTAYGGAMKRVRAGLGVTSFGMQVFDLPPSSRATRSTTTRTTARKRSTPCSRVRRHCTQTASTSCVRACSPARRAGQKRKISTGDQPARILALGGIRVSPSRSRSGRTRAWRCPHPPPPRASLDGRTHGPRHRRQGCARHGREQGNRAGCRGARARRCSRCDRQPLTRADRSRSSRAVE